MVFSSVLFLFRFLPIFMICYFLVPRKMKNLVLFLGSLVFYAWGEPVYIFLMLFSTISDYVWGRLIEEYRGKDRSRIFLLCSIVINLFILGFFKYADFLMQTVNFMIYFLCQRFHIFIIRFCRDSQQSAIRIKHDSC